MKTIVSALIALSLLGLVTPPAHCLSWPDLHFMSRIQILYLGFRSTLFIGSLFLGGTVIWSGQLRDAQNLRRSFGRLDRSRVDWPHLPANRFALIGDGDQLSSAILLARSSLDIAFTLDAINKA
jgi:hypothetical protein